jgi:hypothetical protein
MKMTRKIHWKGTSPKGKWSHDPFKQLPKEEGSVSPEDLCKPNIYGIVHCWHEGAVRTPEDPSVKIEYVLRLETCCWCGNAKYTKHGLHMPKEEGNQNG